MLKPFQTLASSAAALSTQRDVFRRLVVALVDAENGGEIFVWDTKSYSNRWVRVVANPASQYVALVFRHPQPPDPDRWLERFEGFFPAGFKFARFDSDLGAAIWEGARLLNYSLAGQIVDAMERIFLRLYRADSRDLVMGRVDRFYRADEKPDPSRWRPLAEVAPISEADFAEVSQRRPAYTVTQLREMLQTYPEDGFLRLQLAEQTDSVQERIQLIRECLIHRDPPVVGKAHRALNRLLDELPILAYASCSIEALPITDKSGLEFGPGEWFAERVCSIDDWTGPDGAVGQRLGGKDPVFDRIIKLTYCHFWCKAGAVCTLYHSLDQVFVIPAVKFTLAEEPTLDQVVAMVQAANPAAYQRLSINLKKMPDKDAYLSVYRCFQWGFDDFTNPLAKEMALIDNQFRVTLLEPGSQ
jgi:hypothetical protein